MGPYTDERFAKDIDKAKVSVAMEIGSNHAIDAINIKKFYEPDALYVFEADHRSIQICRHNIDGAAVHRGVNGIELITAAARNEAGVTEFFVVASADGRQAGDVVLPAVFGGRQAGIRDQAKAHHRTQPAHRPVLRSIGDRPRRPCVYGRGGRYVAGAAGFRRKPLSSGNTPRIGEALADEVSTYLRSFGFELAEFIEVSPIHGDYLFVNRDPGGA
ncbi:MAG: hypothetical protein VW338_06930 [Rhodospirillaceae bacterium]